jgi:hypothetical protein
MTFLLLLGGKDIQLHPQSFTRQQFRSWEIMPYRYWACILSLFCSHHVFACTSPNCSRLWTSKTKTRCQWNIDVIYHQTRFRWIQYHNTTLKRKPENNFLTNTSNKTIFKFLFFMLYMYQVLMKGRSKENIRTLK